MPYDVKAKHGDLIAFLSEQYQVYIEARSAFLKAQWDREYASRCDRRDEGMAMTVQFLKNDLVWEKTNEDRQKMDKAGMKLYLAIKHAVKHYSYWHTGRIRAASGISSHDWLMLMTPLCLPSYLSMDFESRKQDPWAQAMDLVDGFATKEMESMSGRQYAYELFKRANNLLDMKNAQAVG